MLIGICIGAPDKKQLYKSAAYLMLLLLYFTLPEFKKILETKEKQFCSIKNR